MGKWQLIRKILSIVSWDKRIWDIIQMLDFSTRRHLWGTQDKRARARPISTNSRTHTSTWECIVRNLRLVHSLWAREEVSANREMLYGPGQGWCITLKLEDQELRPDSWTGGRGVCRKKQRQLKLGKEQEMSKNCNQLLSKEVESLSLTRNIKKQAIISGNQVKGWSEMSPVSSQKQTMLIWVKCKAKAREGGQIWKVVATWVCTRLGGSEWKKNKTSKNFITASLY